MSKNIDNLVMGTVNASWKTKLAADQLAQMVVTGEVKLALPHVATFFAEVRSPLITEFAKLHDIGMGQLAATYKTVKSLTGEKNQALEEKLGQSLGRAA